MIIVTGATGFIGSAVVRALNLAGNNQIVAVDVVSPNERPAMMERCHFGSFIHYTELLSFLKNKESASVQAVIHMGAISSTTETNWERLLTHNIQLSQVLFQFCAEKQIPYIYASSGAVYGSGQHGFDDAVAPGTYAPLNLYGQSKRDFDIWALQQEQTPLRWHGLRFFNVYGPNEYYKGEMASVVFKAFKQIKTTGRLKLFKSHDPDFKDGEQKRDFIYVKDITKWILQLLNSENISSGIYNQGYGTARTWLDLASQVFKSMNLPMNIDWVDIPENIRDQYQYFTEAKMDKSFAAGFAKPEFTLEDGIIDYMQNYLLTDEIHL